MMNYFPDSKLNISMRGPKTLFLAVSAAVTLLYNGILQASEQEQFELIQNSIDSGRYYNAVTESMRYSFFYPDGQNSQKVQILYGLALFKGGDFSNALDVTRSSMKYDDRLLQAEAMHNIIYMRLIEGSVYLAQNDMKNYDRNFSGLSREFDEKIRLEQISALAYQENFTLALQQASEYRSAYPDSIYIEDIAELEKLLDAEKNRPMKSPGTALLGSVFIPGFSHFYTGDYLTGTFSLLSNSLLIGLLVNSIMNKNYFETVIFSFMELGFYQDSLIASYRNVAEYNSRENYKKEIKMQIERRF